MIYIKMLRLITHDLLIRLIPRIVFVQNVSVQCYEGARVALYSQNFDQLFSVHYINLKIFLLKKKIIKDILAVLFLTSIH